MLSLPVVALWLTLSLCGAAAATGADTTPSPDTNSAAAALYRTECAGCHGEGGDGKGQADPTLQPPPRDFTRGKFKLRSTDPRQAISVDELMTTITNGIPGSAMPSYGFLSEAERRELAEYVRHFGIAVDAPTGAKIAVGKPPPTTPELLAEGRKQYEELGCPACHGPEGRGDGQSAAALKDEWGNVDPPRDLVHDLNRGGQSDEELYLRLAIGMPGTPMPGYAEVANPQALWALVAYMQSLRQPPPTPPADPVALGKAVFASRHCRACHELGGTGGHVGPSLDNIVARRGVAQLKHFLANPRPTPKIDLSLPARMPQLNLTSAEINGLVRFLEANEKTTQSTSRR